VVDGINTQGLAIGILYFPNYAQYPQLSKKNQSHGLAPWELGTYLLSNFANVEEVKKGLKNVTVLSVANKKDGPVPQYHYLVHDALGKSLVIEYTNGQMQTYDNPLGVLTNSPTFDWQITNLRNYVNLSVNNAPPIKMAGTQVTGFGQGTGLLGLPGDFTPPSRFVRAVVFSQASTPSLIGEEGVFHVFHIMNQFDIPKGAIRNTQDDKTTIEHTLWTTVGNLKDKKYYYRTYDHPNVHMVDLMKMDPHATKIQWFPMSQDVNAKVAQTYRSSLVL
jgi:choloylglycine hydrolase